MFYLKDEDFTEDIRNIKPIGIVASRKTEEKMVSFLERLERYNSNSLVQEIILELDIDNENYVDAFKEWKIIYKEDLDFKIKGKNVFYPKICSTEREIQEAFKEGYINISLDQNLLSFQLLKKLKAIQDVRIFSTANNGYNNSFWIRPEGIKEYSSFINDWFLVATPNMSETIRYYQDGNSLGSKTIIAGLEETEQSGLGLLPQEFDKIRLSCAQHCLDCQICERFLYPFNKIASKNFKDK